MRHHVPPGMLVLHVHPMLHEQVPARPGLLLFEKKLCFFCS